MNCVITVLCQAVSCTTICKWWLCDFVLFVNLLPNMVYWTAQGGITSRQSACPLIWCSLFVFSCGLACFMVFCVIKLKLALEILVRHVDINSMVIWLSKEIQISFIVATKQSQQKSEQNDGKAVCTLWSGSRARHKSKWDSKTQHNSIVWHFCRCIRAWNRILRICVVCDFLAERKTHSEFNSTHRHFALPLLIRRTSFDNTYF